MKTLFVTGAAIAALFAAPAFAASNLVTNGSFENGSNGLQGWTLGGAIGGTGAGASDPVVIAYNSSANYPAGAFGEPIPTDNATSASPDAVGTHLLYLSQDSGAQTLSQSVTLGANQTYTLGFDYYVPQNGYNNPYDATLAFTIGGVTVATLTTGSPTSNTPPVKWFNFNQTFNSGAGGTGNLVFTYSANGYTAADFGVDRVFLSAVPETATWVMMIAGFGLAGAFMRRQRSAGRVVAA